MEYVGRADAFDGRSECVGVGYVTREEMDRRRLPGFEDQIQAMFVFFQVIDPDFLAGVGELLGPPRTNAAVAACQEHAHLVVSVTNRSGLSASFSPARHQFQGNV